MSMTPESLVAAKNAIIRVGAGRGFLVADPHGSCFVMTAAHCLPHLPPAHPASYTEERTYAKLLAPLNGRPAVWCECLFVNPIADLAVLGEPDGQVLPDEWDAYSALADDHSRLQLGAITAPSSGWLLTVAGEWCSGTLKLSLGGWRGSLSADVSRKAVAPGTSGSPILTDEGLAVGVVSSGKELNPVLSNALPAGLLAHMLGKRRRRRRSK